MAGGAKRRPSKDVGKQRKCMAPRLACAIEERGYGGYFAE